MSGQPAGTVWVTCPNCLSRGAVPASAIGAKVRCRQCTSTFLAELERPSAAELLEGELTLAPSDLPPTSGVQTVSAVADEYNLAAEPIPHPMAGTKPPIAPAPDEQPDYVVKPPKGAGIGWAFTSNILQYPWTPAALVQWIICSVSFVVAGTIDLYAFGMIVQLSMGSIVGVFVLVVGVIFSALALSYASTCLLDITVNAAYNCDKLHDWPSQDWVERVAYFFCFLFLCSVSAIPAYAVAEASMLATGIFWPVLVTFMLASFPLLFLSALEADSFFWPFSSAIFGSFGQLTGTWIAFYILSTVLFAGCSVATVLTFEHLQYSTPLVAGPLWAATLFIYGRLLGRMAWLIMQRGAPNLAKRPKREDPLLRGLP